MSTVVSTSIPMNNIVRIVEANVSDIVEHKRNCCVTPFLNVSESVSEIRRAPLSEF
jgi:hypothetical protein